MKTSNYIRNKINRLPKGYIFTYTDFIYEENNRETIIKNLNRMVSNNEIKKLSKGKYYKEEHSVFGTLLPEQSQVVKDLLEKNGKLIGYITGYGYFNNMNLTTQVANIIQIGRNELKPPLKRGRFKVSFVKQKNTITKQNIPLLQILDTIRLIKKIPDTSIDNSCLILMNIIKKLNETEQIALIRLALKYSAMTRALLGAMLENLKISRDLEKLKETLNPITTYNLSISDKVLPTSKNWNIK